MTYPLIAFRNAKRIAPDWAHQLWYGEGGSLVVRDASGCYWLAEIRLMAPIEVFGRSASKRQYNTKTPTVPVLVPVYGPVDPQATRTPDPSAERIHALLLSREEAVA